MLSPETPTLKSQGNDKELRRTERERMKSRTGWCWGSPRRKCFKERRAKALWNKADASDQVVRRTQCDYLLVLRADHQRPDPASSTGQQAQGQKTMRGRNLPQVLVQRGAEMRGGSWQGT